MKKKIIAIALLLSMMFLTVGCGDKNNSATDSSMKATDRPSITATPNRTDNDNPIEDAVDGAAEGVDDAVNGAADGVKDAVDGVTDGVEDAADGLTDSDNN